MVDRVFADQRASHRNAVDGMRLRMERRLSSGRHKTPALTYFLRNFDLSTTSFFGTSHGSMLGRSCNLYLIVALLLALLAGCKKSEPEQKPESPQAQAQPYTNSASGDVIARIHWLGKKRIATDPNAATFMSIWILPESQKLETQTLDKLALAPWDLLRSGTNLSAVIATNASSALLRPLLDDLLQEESYLEIRQTTNQAGQGVLAIHLDDQRAALWNTNFAALRQPFLSAQYSPLTSNLTISRAGQWTLLGFGATQNALLEDVAARIQHTSTPFSPTLTNFWIDAQLDLKRVSESLSLNLPLPKNTPTNINLTLIGDGRDVHTRSELDFPQPLPLELEPWNIPTNLIHDPLIAFSAIRGFRPFLKSFKPWNDLQLGTPPNQAYTWGQQGLPWLHFVAIPSVEASNQVDRFADFVVRDVNPKLAGRLGTFEKIPGSQHLKWQGVPVFSPDVNWTNSEGNSYVIAGFFSHSISTQAPPAELFLQFSGSTNILWYDWEFTKESLKGWVPISQLLRHLFNLPRLQPDPDIAWLLSTTDRVGNSISALKLESPTRLSFTRQSTIGLNAPELPLLLDWLGSPKFPRGLHTFLAPRPEIPTNAVPGAATISNTNSAGGQKNP
jgi:hypothetical protein